MTFTAQMHCTDAQDDTTIERISDGGGITAYVLSGEEPSDVEVVVLSGGIERAERIATLLNEEGR